VIDEAIAFDNLAGFDGDRFAERRSGIDSGVKLALLAAGIDAVRQVAEEAGVELRVGKFYRQHLGIDADDAGAQSAGDHLLRRAGAHRCPRGETEAHRRGGDQFIRATRPRVEAEALPDFGRGIMSVGRGPAVPVLRCRL